MSTYYKATRCACGCGEEVKPDTRYIHGHNARTRARVPLEKRFWTRVSAGKPSECWAWLGGRDSDGRGRIWHEGRNIPAPRVALILSGTPVPHGAFACHHCDNPNCVNPAHVYVGSALSNVADMDARGRRGSSVRRPRARGERNHNAKLTDEQVRWIRERYTGRRGEQTALASEYGVTPQLVSLIVRGDHRAVL